MKNKLMKIVSFVLVVSLLLPGTIAFAQESADSEFYKVIEENSSIRVTESQDSRNIYRATYNKHDGSVQVSIIDLETGNIKVGDTVKASAYPKSIISTRSASVEENTFCNFEYTKWIETPNKWQIRRPREGFNNWYYFDTTESDSNRSYLTSFQGTVEKINDQEFIVIGSFGANFIASFLAGVASAGAVVSGGTLTPAAYAAIGGAITALGNNEYQIIKYGELMETAYEEFFEIVNHS